VVNDLVAMDLVFAALIGDGPMPERGADHLGNDPVEAYWASSALLHAAFARPGVLERSYSGPVGSATGDGRSCQKTLSRAVRASRPTVHSGPLS
jgi:hypothetical protein